jgi:hypothetical protein
MIAKRQKLKYAVDARSALPKRHGPAMTAQNAIDCPAAHAKAKCRDKPDAACAAMTTKSIPP